MAVSYVGMTRGTNAADPGRNLPVSPVAATLPGDLLIVVFTLASSTAALTPAAGWTTGDTGIGALAAGHRAGIFYKIAVAGDETTTYQFPTSPNTLLFAEAVLYVLRGIDTTTPVLNHAVRNDASSYVTSIPAPALTVNGSGDATFYAYTGFTNVSTGGSNLIVTLPGTLSNPIGQSLATDMSDTIGIGWGINVTAPGPGVVNFVTDYITFGLDLKPLGPSTIPGVVALSATAGLTTTIPQPLTPGGRQFYASVNLGGGLRGINAQDPVNPQDAATKNYLGTRNSLILPAGGAYWEALCQAQAVANSYAGGWANGGGNLTGSGQNAGLPPNITITKLYASTRIRVKIFNVSSWATSGAGYHYWGASVNGGAILEVTHDYFNRVGVRMAAPFGVVDFVPASYAQVNGTGPMNVLWYIQTSSGCGWNVDGTDSFYGASGLISEMP